MIQLTISQLHSSVKVIHISVETVLQNFEYWSFPNLAIGSSILSHDVVSEPQLPVSHVIMRVNNRYIYKPFCINTSILFFSFSSWQRLYQASSSTCVWHTEGERAPNHVTHQCGPRQQTRRVCPQEFICQLHHSGWAQDSHHYGRTPGEYTQKTCVLFSPSWCRI